MLVSYSFSEYFSGSPVPAEPVHHHNWILSWFHRLSYFMNYRLELKKGIFTSRTGPERRNSGPNKFQSLGPFRTDWSPAVRWSLIRMDRYLLWNKSYILPKALCTFSFSKRIYTFELFISSCCRFLSRHFSKHHKTISKWIFKGWNMWNECFYRKSSMPGICCIELTGVVRPEWIFFSSSSCLAFSRFKSSLCSRIELLQVVYWTFGCNLQCIIVAPTYSLI